MAENSMMDQIDDDAIVISGISGSFADCDNVEELAQKLMEGTDCITVDGRGWGIDNPSIPKRYGRMRNINKFDNLFFGVRSKLAAFMDPMARMFMERSFEAICDAGINPRDIRGGNTHVFVGNDFSEAEKAGFLEKLQKDGFGLLGGAKTMLPNRASFAFNFHGQSLTIDALSVASGVALSQAFLAIKDGRCDSALVGGTSTCLFPHLSVNFSQLKCISPDGIHRAFDANACGSTRSEAVVALFLQKAKYAKRIYAEILSTRTDIGENYVERGILFATPNLQERVMRECLEEAKVRPEDVDYVEADGLGIKINDMFELEAIDRVYGSSKRSEPVLVGAVKSNIGDCYASNTLTSIVKVLIAMKEGKIPPNLHFEKPPEEAKALLDGRLKIVTEPTPWNGKYAVVNTTSLAGSFTHVVLKAHRIVRKKKDNGDDLPRLVSVHSRTEDGVKNILDYLTTNPVNIELCHMLNEIFKKDRRDFFYCGYTVLPPSGVAENIVKEISPVVGNERKIWFVFSGMGSQWSGMGTALMKIPIFARAIMKCDAVLRPRGFDIIRVLTDTDPKMFNNVVHCFIGIAAIQIGLVDILNAVGVKPDYLIGHSVGELGCAYADGCFDAEQMILSSLSRGLATIESDLIHGSMAAVGLGYDEIKSLCPPDIDVACRNSSTSTTISGPSESMKVFVDSLQKRGIFAKEVPCGGVAYHSRYIAPAGKKLLQRLRQVIPKPKPRSTRWISTSVPKSEWSTAKARLSSAEYHTNNLLSPVLLEDVIRQIPKDAVLIEIAPHGLLQAILKRAVHKECINISLTRRESPDNVTTLLTGLGKLCNAEVQVDIEKIYQSVVEYPVNTSTPLISPFIKWHYAADWRMTNFKDKKYVKGENTYNVNLSEDDFKYLNGYKIDGKVVLPFGFYLYHAIETLKLLANITEELTYIFQNIRIHETLVVIPENKNREITLMLQKGSGHFEVCEGTNVLMSGDLSTVKSDDVPETVVLKNINEKETIKSDYVYKELFMRGMEYKENFRCIDCVNRSETSCYVNWKEDLVQFFEGLTQLQAFCEPRPFVKLPNFVEKIVFDEKLHNEIIKKTNKIPVHLDTTTNTISAGAIEMKGLQLSVINKYPSGTKIIAEGIKFVENQDDLSIDLPEAIQVVTELIAENLSPKKINNILILEDKNDSMSESLDYLTNILQSVEGTFKVRTIAEKEKGNLKDASLLVVNNIHEKTELLNNINNENFLLTIVNQENQKEALSTINKTDLALVLKKRISTGKMFMLFRKKQLPKNPLIVEIQNDWTTHVKNALNNANYDRVIVLIRKDNDDEILQKLKKLRVESTNNAINNNKLQVLDLKNSSWAPPFSLQDPFYRMQLQLNLHTNVLVNKSWGTMRKIPACLETIPASHWIVRQSIPGDPKSIELVEAAPQKETQKPIKVHYSGLDSEDLKRANTVEIRSFSKTNRDESFGLNYSGVDSSGKKIMGIAPGSLTNILINDPIFTWPIPDSWSLENAATVPSAYLIAYFAIFTCEEITNDRNKVLVHRPASDVGQAAINVALSANCEVVATYSSESEKLILDAAFPNEKRLSVISIDDFVDHIKWKDGRASIDIGICYADDPRTINQTALCLKDRQYLIIIGNVVESIHDSISMAPFLKGLHVHSVNPRNMSELSVEKKTVLANLLGKGIQNGVVKPIVKKWVYPVDTLTDAIEDFEAKVQHGKVVVKVEGREQPALARATFSNDKTCVLIDGLNDFGIRMAGWLICKGARKIIIASQGTANEYAAFCLSEYRKRGVELIVYERTNLSNKKNVQLLLEEAKKLGELEGIFDLQRMNTENTNRSSYSAITRIIDEESRSISNLRYFVVSSSSNSLEDVISGFPARDIVAQKVCEERKSNGLPGLMILWGPIRQVNKLEDNKIKGVNCVEISQCLGQLDGLLKSVIPIIAVFGRINVLEAEEEETKEEVQKDEKTLFEEMLYSGSVKTSIFEDVLCE